MVASSASAGQMPISIMRCRRRSSSQMSRRSSAGSRGKGANTSNRGGGGVRRKCSSLKSLTSTSILLVAPFLTSLAVSVWSIGVQEGRAVSLNSECQDVSVGFPKSSSFRRECGVPRFRLLRLSVGLAWRRCLYNSPLSDCIRASPTGYGTGLRTEVPKDWCARPWRWRRPSNVTFGVQRAA